MAAGLMFRQRIALDDRLNLALVAQIKRTFEVRCKIRTNAIDLLHGMRPFALMTRRTRAQSMTDELAFSVRLKIAVLPNGLGPRLKVAHDWLKRSSAQASGQSILGRGSDTILWRFTSGRWVRLSASSVPFRI